MYDIKQAIYEQAKYCVEHGLPHFAPITGNCFRCGRNIYDAVVWPDGQITGVTAEAAKSGLITGCPHCHRTYCD